MLASHLLWSRFATLVCALTGRMERTKSTTAKCVYTVKYVWRRWFNRSVFGHFIPFLFICCAMEFDGLLFSVRCHFRHSLSRFCMQRTVFFFVEMFLPFHFQWHAFESLLSCVFFFYSSSRDVAFLSFTIFDINTIIWICHATVALISIRVVLLLLYRVFSRRKKKIYPKMAEHFMRWRRFEHQFLQ